MKADEWAVLPVKRQTIRATVTCYHQSLSNEEENVDGVQTVADVFPVWGDNHHGLSVSPGQVIVVITCGIEKNNPVGLNASCVAEKFISLWFFSLDVWPLNHRFTTW